MKYLIPLVVVAFAFAACDSKPPAKPNATAATAPTISTEKAMADQTVTHTDEEWKKILTPEQYRVLREKGTERPFTGEFDNFYEGGTYSCAACGQELFSSKTKFDAGCGWPAFYAAQAGDRVKLVDDYSFGMKRTEVMCSKCGGHLGHIFYGETHEIDGKTQSVDRYCINSVSIKFTPAAKK